MDRLGRPKRLDLTGSYHKMGITRRRRVEGGFQDSFRSFRIAGPALWSFQRSRKLSGLLRQQDLGREARHLCAQDPGQVQENRMEGGRVGAVKDWPGSQVSTRQSRSSFSQKK